MFDGFREDWQEQPRPAFVRRGSVSLPLILGALVFGALMLFMALARAQNPPSGTPVFNQITQIRQITVGTTKFTSSKAFLIDAASSCSVTFLAAGDLVSQTIGNLATGIWHPMSINQVSASTCPANSLFAGY